MQHYRPHKNATFEGYYSKFHCNSGAHIALVICSVPNAEKRRHLLSFTYYPAATSDASHVFQREVFLDHLDFQSAETNSRNSDFTLTFDYGSMNVSPSGRTVWEIHHSEFDFRAETRSQTQTPWLKTQLDTPEGPLVHLPLPLHWHVQSLATDFHGSLKLTHQAQPDELHGIVHQEKNWATSFPSAHIWIQARKSPFLPTPQDCATGEESGICLAGGQTLGTNSYLMSYHSCPSTLDPLKGRYNVTTRPPLSTELTIPILKPLTRPFTNLLAKSKIDYPRRSAELSFFCPSSYPTSSNTRPLTPGAETAPRSLSARVLTTLTTLLPCLPPFRYMTIKATAPHGSFFSLTAPFADGHRPNFLAQSFRATVHVSIFELEERIFIDFGHWLGLGRNKYVLSLPTHWRKMHEESFENGSLEFGADWYEDKSE